MGEGGRRNVRPDLDPTLVRIAVTYNVHRGLRELDHELLLEFLDRLDDTCSSTRWNHGLLVHA